jgi:hypothetical protein
MKPGDLRKFLDKMSVFNDDLVYADDKVFMILSIEENFRVAILINGRYDPAWSVDSLACLSWSLDETG